MQGFVFGSKDKDKPWTYEELQRKREIAETLAAGNLRTPQNVGEGLASIGRALMYRKLDKRAGAEESRMRDEFNAKWGSVFGGYGGGAPGMAASGGGGAPSGSWTPEAPGPKATETHMGMPDVAKGGLSFGGPKADTGVAQGGNDFGAAVMTPQEMLIAGAKARGLDPIDVATAISYETGGKFDPTIKGPTTQWGTHEGLIQFGDPQGEKYGADFSSPEAAWRSQLNPENGAVWGYLEDTGVKPGMGLPEIYSAINAGGVGRMGASDANNGGAPGTVADKVASMGPHREKAAAFLGGTWTPDPNAGAGGGNVTMSAKGPGPAMGMDIGALVGLASDPMASPAQKAIIETLIQQQLQAADPMRALQMEKAQLELAQMKEPQPGFTTIPAQEAAQLGLPEGGVYQRGPTGEIEVLVEPPKAAGADPATYGTTLQFFTGEDGKLRAGVLGNDGTMKEIEPPGGGDWAQGVEKVDAGTKWLFYDKRTGEMVGEQPKDLRGAESEKAIGKAEGEAIGAASTGLGAAETQAAEGVALIQSIIDDPALPSITGMIQGRMPPLSQAGTDLNEKIKQVKGKAFLEAFDSLKGGGAISEREGEAATQAIARLERAQSEEAYIEALAELQGILKTGLDNMKKKAGEAGTAAPQSDLGLTEDDLKYLE